MCAYTHVDSLLTYYTSESDLTYSSVAVDHDGNRLEHRGDNDFA